MPVEVNLIIRLRERAVAARAEGTATALGDALHFEEAAKRIVELEAELFEYSDAARYDPMMSGEARFFGWNLSTLNRARKMTEERLGRRAPLPLTAPMEAEDG